MSMRYAKHPNRCSGAVLDSETGLLMPIERMTRSDKCIGIIERKVITDVRRAFPESEGDF